jgi:hypothetical protein
MHNAHASGSAAQMNPKQEISNKYHLDEWRTTTGIILRDSLIFN